MEIHSSHQVPQYLLQGPKWGGGVGWARIWSSLTLTGMVPLFFSFANHTLPTPAGRLQFSERPESRELPETSFSLVITLVVNFIWMSVGQGLLWGGNTTHMAQVLGLLAPLTKQITDNLSHV